MLGPTHHQQDSISLQLPTSPLQLLVLRSQEQGSGLPAPRLEQGKQLCHSPYCPYPTHPQLSQETVRNGDNHCPQVTRLLLVQPPQATHNQHTSTRPSLCQELQKQIQSHTRAPAQQALEVGSLQNLWLPNPAGWSSAAANLLNNALATSTWKCYAGNLHQFKVYCLTNDIPFPPEQEEAVGVVASFFESATRSSQQPHSTIASLSTAIGALYETTDFHPTHDPLLSQVKCALVHLHTTWGV